MFESWRIAVVIPARNEAESIIHVVHSLLQLKNNHGQELIDQIVVCDNGSTDGTGERARQSGAEVVVEPVAGYGAACLRAIERVSNSDVVVFVDADQSVDTRELPLLLEKLSNGFDLVVGVRVPAKREPGAMGFPQCFGNALATVMIKTIWRKNVRDLGPFRAIRHSALQRLNIQDRRFGWTVEMQVKAIQQGIGFADVDVSCRRRVGKSKVSGTLAGICGAGYGIISTILKLAANPPKVV